jgi:hypothetical protein
MILVLTVFLIALIVFPVVKFFYDVIRTVIKEYEPEPFVVIRNGKRWEIYNKKDIEELIADIEKEHLLPKKD